MYINGEKKLKKKLYEVKYQLLINKWQDIGLNHIKDPKAFIQYSNDVNDVYKDTEENKTGKKRKVLIMLDDIDSI